MKSNTYETTPNADWRILRWAVVKADVKDVLICWQSPLIFRRYSKDLYKIKWRLPLRVEVPLYLAAEFGFQVLKSRDWVIPF